MTESREKDGGEHLLNRSGIDADEPDFVLIQRSPEFAELRSRLRRFVFPVSLLFLVWYLGYVVLAAYATEFMSRRVVGSVTVGLLLGLAQFASTLLITLWYRRYARRRVDPKVAAVRMLDLEDRSPVARSA